MERLSAGRILSVVVVLLMAVPSAGLLGSAIGLGATLTPAGPTRGTANPSIAALGREVPGPIAPPRLPHAVTGGRSPGGLVINPNAGYTAEPAPMGIADLGVTSTGAAYTYGTSAFLGTVYWNQENFGGGGTQFTVQLNVILRFTIGTTTYAYWIQDVAEPSDNGGNSLTMSYIDNVWNMSGSFLMNSQTLSGNGTIQSAGANQDYYYVTANPSLPGESQTINAPGQFSLLVRSYRTQGGQPEVSFEYLDGATNYYVTYDNVIFTFAKKVTQDNGFTVDGTQYTPAGSPLMYSAEMDIGGPGGGAAATMGSPTNMHITLYHFNGDNFQSTQGAWNFGGDTAEAVSPTQSIWMWDRDGTLATTQLNGTTRDATPQIAYSPSQVGSVNVSAPCTISNGVLAVGATPWFFNGTWANVTLYPGSYHLWMNDSTTSDDLGMATLGAGGFRALSAASICGSGSTPTVSVPTATPPSVDVGESVTFTTTASGGSGTYSAYTWSQSSASLNCTLASGASITCVPTATGTYTVSVSVTDSNGVTSTLQTSPSFPVDPAPAVTVPTAAPSTVEVGQAVTFTTTASGGSGTYSTYTWTYSPSGLGCTTSTTSTLSCAPTATGTYTVTVSVTDSNGGTSAVQTATPFPVIAGPAVTVPTPSPSSAVVGQTVTFSTTASGGSGTYSAYTWTQSSASLNCTLASAASLTCVPTVAGSYTVSVSVTDSNGGVSPAQTSAPFTVSTLPTVTVPIPSPASIEVGQTVTFSTTASGGSGTYPTYTWSQSSSGLGCTLANAATLTCTPTAPGTYTVAVMVTDSSGSTSPLQTSAGFSVGSGPAVTMPVPSPTQGEVGLTTTFSTTASGGSGTYPTYTWTASSPSLGCTLASARSISCTPTTAGTYTVTVSVIDSVGGRSSTETSQPFAVSDGPAVSVPTASPAAGVVGQLVTFSTTASGGSGTYPTYTWTESATTLGCTLASASSVRCTPTASGSYTVSVSVQDSLGALSTLTTSASFPVSAPAALTLTSFASNPASLGTGQNTTLTVVVSGGTAPYTFSYTGLPAGCASRDVAQLTCAPSAPGNFTVTVTVRDSASHAVSGTTHLTVNLAGSAPGASSINGLYEVLLVAIVAAVIGAILVVLRRRNRPRSEPYAYEGGYGPSTPSQWQSPAGSPPPPPGGEVPPPPPPDYASPAQEEYRSDGQQVLPPPEA